ncbi:hypothetical protein J1N35_003852 [Gossypium stocksii]|uniref:Uncharacterized protein n=1 Tax=Gossypium stocksii TaxID=47602 RepID=A0A9D4AFH9_9ROSI|nr:hypothetical protein J1N35_003852 [Gossypium stocksii]
MNGFDAAKLTKLEIFEGRFTELIDFNAYTKSIQGQELTSYLLVMAPLEAKFNLKPLVKGIEYVYRFKFNFHGDRMSHRTWAIKHIHKGKGVRRMSFIGEKRTIMEVTGVLEMGPAKLVEELNNRGFEVQLVDEMRKPPLLPLKDVILGGCCLCHSKASKAVGLTIKAWRNKLTQLITVPSFFCGGSFFDVVLRRMHPSLVVLYVIKNFNLVSM